MSVTKSITAILVLRAIDNGLFNLDSKVTNFLPKFPLTGTLENREPPSANS
ncbi:hypothetical protein C8034_v007969 [Colletotrichum sidae]|uniref:Beta-lactamase-related domain-containing protein n=1 Tax=Colletotrichum sidae TaxID=1347389 RepID=A0A4R8T3N6_9PEZI|nr:hypothetical protein C8034_v007969 [Colletotrichum sidae]